MQLRWRIEDLQSRLDDISAGNYGVVHYYMDCRYSKNDLAYSPPEYFSRASDIMTSISITAEKLTLMEVEEADIQSKETAITALEEIPEPIWDILPADIVEQSESELKAAA